ncbi:MAG: gluconate 2-dehydrogenase subunit 3 family protein [Bacteroidota bacterium]
MDRRSAVRNFIVFSAGVTLLPSCLQQDSKSSLPLKNIQVSGDQEKMVAELTETILPTNDTPGAKGLSSQLFVLMMVDDCFKKEEQEKFIKGLQQFDEVSRKKIGEPFVKATAPQRAALLKEIENKKDTPEEVLAFYNATKRLTVQSFTGSKYFLTKVRPYDMVPGRFHGCFPVANPK